jgi:hypothetical protein
MRKTLVNNKDKEYYERQINALNSKLEKFLEENKKHFEKNIELEEENKVFILIFYVSV